MNPSNSSDENIEITESNETLKDLIKFFRDFIVILLIVIFVRSFLVTPFRINGDSMETSYHNKEYILVNKFSYLNFATHFEEIEKNNESNVVGSIFQALGKLPIHLGDPERWDVVVLRPHVDEMREYYIKRVVGIPGDIIRFEDGNVLIKKQNAENFVQIDESDYLSNINNGHTYLPASVEANQFTVPEGYYWVMGDNRQWSADSRSCFVNNCLSKNSTHFVSRANIVGKVLIDFGYFNLFKENKFPELGTLKWVHSPRFFNTPKDAKYPELEQSTNTPETAKDE